MGLNIGILQFHTNSVMIRKSKYRSHCPLARSLDILGDKWTLLVLREVILHNKHTFKELSQMKERIASNILADRLERLVNCKMLKKRVSDYSKLVFIYEPTQMSLDLVPAVTSLAGWSAAHLFKKNEFVEQYTV